MTVVMPGLDIDPLVLEDIEQAVACECSSHSPSNPDPAKWIMWFACCGVPTPYMLACTGCKDAKLASPCIQCWECDAMFTPGSTAYSLIDAINRRS